MKKPASSLIGNDQSQALPSRCTTWHLELVWILKAEAAVVKIPDTKLYNTRFPSLTIQIDGPSRENRKMSASLVNHGYTGNTEKEWNDGEGNDDKQILQIVSALDSDHPTTIHTHHASLHEVLLSCRSSPCAFNLLLHLYPAAPSSPKHKSTIYRIEGR